MLAATWTTPLAPRDADDVVRTWLQDLFGGRWSTTAYELAASASGARWLLPAFALAAGALLAVAVRAEREVSPPRAAPA